jgi:hypothetical protein
MATVCCTMAISNAEQSSWNLFNLATLPDTYHHDFVSFISLAHQLQLDFPSVTWQPALYKL